MPTKVWFFFNVFGKGMMGRWIDCMMLAVQTRFTLDNDKRHFSSPLYPPSLYFFLFYFCALCMNQKYKPETFYLKHFFKSPITFFFSFLWTFLKNGREEEDYFFFLFSFFFIFPQSWVVFLWNIIDFSFQISRDISETKARQRWGTSEIFSDHLVKE